MTMPEAVQAIVESALIEGRSEADVYAEKRVEWRLPTVAAWPILRDYYYA